MWFGLLYWPDGPDKPPQEHVGKMANTALIGDNHGMFHQVGPFDQGTRLVTPRAELARADTLSISDIARIIERDLEERGSGQRFISITSRTPVASARCTRSIQRRSPSTRSRRYSTLREDRPAPF